MNSDDTLRVFLGDSVRTRWLLAGMVIVGVAIFGFATGVLMAPYAPVLGARLEELTCLQLAFTGERAMAILASFTPVERDAIAHLMVPGDMVFAFGYGFLVAGLLGLLTLRLPPAWQRAGAWLMWAPLAASAFDCVEDTFLYQMTVAAGGDLGAAPLFGSAAASLKYLLLAGVAPAYGIAGSLRGLRSDRRPGALLVYALTVLVVLSIVARPLRQIPACLA